MNPCKIRGHREIITICGECGEYIDRATFKAPDEWISVEDRLPEEGQWILTFRRFINIKKWEHGMFYDGDTHCYCPIGVEDGITHWMPLPKAPGE